MLWGSNLGYEKSRWILDGKGSKIIDQIESVGFKSTSGLARGPKLFKCVNALGRWYTVRYPPLGS